MRMTLPRFLALIVVMALFVTFVMDTLADGLEPFVGDRAAVLLSGAPLLAVVAVWGWYLYGPPDGARAEREAERRKKEGQ